MMRQGMVGYTGFVGSNLCRQTPFTSFFNSKNMQAIAGESFDTLVFAGAPATKWLANREPAQDWSNLQQAMTAMMSVKAKQVVLISTVDVIPASDTPQDETVDCTAASNHAYGAHRLALEQFMRQQFENVLIVRLPGLFGPGLKKNVLYDLMHDNMLAAINPESCFQYYDIRRLWADVTMALDNRLELVHLCTQPIATREILQRFFPHKQVGQAPSPAVHYDHRTRFDRVYGGQGGWIASAASVLARMGDYLNHAGALR